MLVNLKQNDQDCTMKNILIVAVFFLTSIGFSQQHVNTKKGYAAEGYDVVAYFSNEAKKGVEGFNTSFNGVKYKFSSQKNLEIFKKDPQQYIPQYGGYCAYAVAQKGEKVGVNPKTFQVVDGKLYLFYNSWGINTLDKWNDENPEALQKQADDNWKNIVMEGN